MPGYIFRSSNSFIQVKGEKKASSTLPSAEMGELDVQTLPRLDVLEIKEVTVLHNSHSEVVENNPLLSRAKKE